MSIRSAMVLLGVCAGVCAHASPVFTAGDVYWISKSPMQMVEVTGGGNFAGATPFTVFPTQWESSGNVVFLEDLSAAYATVSSLSGYATGAVIKITPDGNWSSVTQAQSPSGIAQLGNTIYYTTKSGELYKLVNGSPALVSSGFTGARTLIAWNDSLLVSEPGNGRIRQITFAGSTVTSKTLVSNLISPMDVVVLGNTLYYTSIQGFSAESGTVTQVRQVDLNTKVDDYFASGQRFLSLNVAGNKLLAGNYQTSPSGIWDITAGGTFSSAAAWAYGLPGFSDTMLATVPGTPPPPTPVNPDPVNPLPTGQVPEPSTFLLIATGAVLIGLRQLRLAQP